MIGATVPFSHSHRHWPHTLMVRPLHRLSVEEPANRALLKKTLQDWLTINGGGEIYGWSNLAASLLYATMENGEKALEHLHAHNNDKCFVMPNTTSLAGAVCRVCPGFIFSFKGHLKFGCFSKNRVI